MNNKYVKIALTVCAIVVLVLGGLFLKNKFASQDQGHIIVELVGLDGKQIKEKKIAFSEGDELLQLLNDNFNNVKFENGMLLNIEDYETPADWSTFISVYVDGEMSMVGIPEIQFNDGTKISLIITEYIQ